MSTPVHRSSEKRGVRNECIGDSVSSLLFTRSSLALYLMAALAAVLMVACSSEPAPLPPTPTAVPTVAPTAAPAVTPPATPITQSTDRGMAPNFSLPSAGGNEVALSGLLEEHEAVVLVFYRGYF